MLDGWTVVTIAFAYVGLLFAIAAIGDRMAPSWLNGSARPYIYSFSIAVYCTSWTFFGGVGLATETGLEFIALYAGPIIAFTVGAPLIRHIVRLAKAQNITSIADFMSARFGKSQSLSVLISVGLVVAVLPYIALQLEAIAASVELLLTGGGSPATGMPDFALWMALVLAAFAALFGTRRADATEHQNGLMLAIATESVVKLLAFIIVGVYAIWFVFEGPDDLIQRSNETNLIQRFEQMPRLDVWATVLLMSFAAVFLLPRQFHVTVVENSNEEDVRHASWLFPIYLLLIVVLIIPISLAGMLMFGDGGLSPDMYVLSLPIISGNIFVTVAACIGGFSAATAMVIVETVALAIMISNNIAVPALLRYRNAADVPKLLLLTRRVSIVAILLMAYTYHRLATHAGLSNIGLLSLSALIQFAPAFFGGLFWRDATARGAFWGITTGFLVWAYTLLLPGIGGEGLSVGHIATDGLLGLDWLKPQALFGANLDPLVHGVVWSVGLNIGAFVFGSLTRAGSPMERLQANVFVGPHTNEIAQSFHGWHTPIEVGQLQATVGTYLGEERTAKAFQDFGDARSARQGPAENADIHMLRFAEHLLASVIGSPSSRLVLSRLLQRGAMSQDAAMQLLDDASAAILYSRDLLQTALDHARQGVAVFDRDLRLACWNREYVRIFGYPQDVLKTGMPLDEIIRVNAERGLYGAGRPDELLAERLQQISQTDRSYRTTFYPMNRVIEIRTNRMPDMGLVATFTDVTETVEAEKALERRVDERTRELTELNKELARAKAQADDANVSKTRFLAAASHDILQPLNAARLYVASLTDSAQDGRMRPELVTNIDASLQSVEEIFTTLLDISRLDAGALKPELKTVRIGDMLRQLEVEFAPMAKEKDLSFKVIPSKLCVRSDPRLLRRLLQNLVSNAIKYTNEGRVLVGVRRNGANAIRVEVWDTGLGIPASKQSLIFKEFQRLESGARAAQGLGLGLSIVERVARVLNHPLKLVSKPGEGSMFAVQLPIAPDLPQAVDHPRRSVAESRPLSGTRVLCVDNEPAILEGMRMLLGGWGCEVLTAADLEEALDRIKAGRPDVLIADYHLDEGQDGLSAIRSLRDALGVPPPAILITADRSQTVRDATRAQAVELLHKPLRPASLRALLGQLRIHRPAAE
ncbi:NahK/ErcS family hybrid sensor histidine kinase/response regulator [Flaviflagellibacter deserti]|uniref:histidine kinase n=1 Tax=Flaviflagellibacter deserti TaxID=2267266 RepID=A0ABV9YXE3_9HYPH